jgi:hypothetical protein
MVTSKAHFTGGGKLVENSAAPEHNPILSPDFFRESIRRYPTRKWPALGTLDQLIGRIRKAQVAGAAVIGTFHDTMVRDAVADPVFEVFPLTNPAVKNHLHFS